MTKLSVEELVRAVVAHSARDRSPGQIADSVTLHELGYTDADAQELQLRLVKATSARRSMVSKLERASPITPDLTVRAVIEGLQKTLPARAAKAPGGKGDPRRRRAEVAVIAALSQVSPKLDFSQIEPDMRLSTDLGLDEAALPEVKIAVFKMLPSEQSLKSFSTLRVSASSTVEAMIDEVASSLTGEVTTGRKGVKKSGVVTMRTTGRKRPIRAKGDARLRPALGHVHLDPDVTRHSREVLGARTTAPSRASLAGDTTTGKKG